MTELQRKSYKAGLKGNRNDVIYFMYVKFCSFMIFLVCL